MSDFVCDPPSLMRPVAGESAEDFMRRVMRITGIMHDEHLVHADHEELKRESQETSEKLARKQERKILRQLRKVAP